MFVAHVDYFLHLRVKLVVEAFHLLGPIFLSLGNLVKLLFYVGCEVIVHNLLEVLHQEIVHYYACVGRYEFSPV